MMLLIDLLRIIVLWREGNIAQHLSSIDLLHGLRLALFFIIEFVVTDIFQALRVMMLGSLHLLRGVRIQRLGVVRLVRGVVRLPGVGLVARDVERALRFAVARLVVSTLGRAVQGTPSLGTLLHFRGRWRKHLIYFVRL